jgi:hypothetical protein
MDMACTIHAPAVPDRPAEPDTCFACKMAYKRRGHGQVITYAHGRDDFHGPTVRERQARDLKFYRDQGMTHVEPVGSRWV